MGSNFWCIPPKFLRDRNSKDEGRPSGWIVITETRKNIFKKDKKKKRKLFSNLLLELLIIFWVKKIKIKSNFRLSVDRNFFFFQRSRNWYRKKWVRGMSWFGRWWRGMDKGKKWERRGRRGDKKTVYLASFDRRRECESARRTQPSPTGDQEMMARGQSGGWIGDSGFLKGYNSFHWFI